MSLTLFKEIVLYKNFDLKLQREILSKDLDMEAMVEASLALE